MIRITGYGVIAEKPRVGKLGHFFRAPSMKNYPLDQQMNDTFMMGTTSSITMQSLGKIAQCAPTVGAKMSDIEMNDIESLGLSQKDAPI